MYEVASWRFGLSLALLLSCMLGSSGSTAAMAAPQVRTRVAGAVSAGVAGPASDPGICSGCEPPLRYQGGPVLTTGGGGLTVTPIYWEPSGGQYVFPAGYESIINGFVANVAVASGKSDNVVSVVTEYYQTARGVKLPAIYRIRAGTPILDTGAYPSNGCTPAKSSYTACITDEQIRTELKRITAARGLPTDLAHFYPVFLPPKVETQDRDRTNSEGDYCAYHRAFGSGSNVTVYGDEPYEGSGCDGGQAPNGNLAADGAVSTLSHELDEAITDPENPSFAWTGKAGHELADMCANNYGPALGSTSTANPSGTEYNQVIGGGRYYLQEEYSNVAYTKLGVAKGCVLSEAAARQPSRSGTQGTTGPIGGGSESAAKSKPVTVVLGAFPNAVRADGKTTSEVTFNVSDAQGNVVQGDRVHFGIGVQSGSGQCGTLSSTEQTTNADGFAKVTYTASSDNVSCWVLAVDADRGQASEALIYQGTTRTDAPTFNATFPASLQAGGSPRTFTIKAINPSFQSLPSTRVTFDVFPGDGTTKYLEANQVHLSYSTTGPHGVFVPVALEGSTTDGGAIEGSVEAAHGITLPAASSQTFTFRVSLAHNVPVSKTKPLLAFEAYLDQIDIASGSAATLGDTEAYQVLVPAAATPSSSSTENLLIAIGALVVLAGLVFVGRRMSRGPRETPPPASP